MQEQELFQGYEVKNWDFSPRIYKILAVSAIFNILGLLVVAQTNLLTTKGCDSPLVGKVCQVIDTVYVGGTVLTTNSETVNEPYNPTDISDAEIVWVNRTGEEKFNYPDGYFGLSNPPAVPVEIPADDSEYPVVSGINPPMSVPGGSGLINTKPILPKNDAKIGGTLPDDPLGAVNNPPTNNRNNRPYSRIEPYGNKNKKIPNESPNELPSFTKKPNTEANNNQNITGVTPNSDGDIKINKAPLLVLKDDVNKLRSENKFNPSVPFQLQAKGKLDKDGKIDPKTAKFIAPKDIDPTLFEVLKKSVFAISESGYLQYLSRVSAQDLAFDFKQDGTNLTAVIQSEMKDETRAKSVLSLLNLAITASKTKKTENIAKMQNEAGKEQDLQNEMDDLEILKGATLSTDGKKIVIQFLVPQDVAIKMIERKLDEKTVEKPAEKKENGSTAQVEKNKQITAK